MRKTLLMFLLLKREEETMNQGMSVASGDCFQTASKEMRILVLEPCGTVFGQQFE